MEHGLQSSKAAFLKIWEVIANTIKKFNNLKHHSFFGCIQEKYSLPLISINSVKLSQDSRKYINSVLGKIFSPSELIAAYDSCVLYPAPLRDLLMHLALTDLFQAKWTDTIHQEWMKNVLANRPELTLYQLQHTRDLMNMHDCLVTGHEVLNIFSIKINKRSYLRQFKIIRTVEHKNFMPFKFILGQYLNQITRIKPCLG